MSRWLRLCWERFPPGAYLPMVVLFVLGNGAVAVEASGGGRLPLAPLGVAFLVSLSFFFRLRLFDEIKDYDTDLEINPTRPLPRGLVGLGEVKKVIAACTVLEFALASLLGVQMLMAHAVAVAYSFLMYNEFFVGRLLRPHLTTYAVTHTLSSVLIGHSIGAMVSGRGLLYLPQAALLFGLTNWALFNVFEFARKTYAPAEERPGVDSYSSLFKPLGAVLLTLSQVVAALLLVGWLSGDPHALFRRGEWLWHIGAAALVVVPGLVYAARPAIRTASLYRNLAGLYILVYYASVSFQVLR